jgi:transcriptional regulator with XRE-family HTH domain
MLMQIRLKEWRERRGLSIRVLAQLAGVNYVSLARIEGGRLDPRVSTLRALASALGVSISDLFFKVSEVNLQQEEGRMGKEKDLVKYSQKNRDEKVTSALLGLREWRRKHLLKGMGELIWDYEWEQVEALTKALEKLVVNLKGPDDREKE